MAWTPTGSFHPPAGGETGDERMNNTLSVDGYLSSEPITPEIFPERGNGSMNGARIEPKEEDLSNLTKSVPDPESRQDSPAHAEAEVDGSKVCGTSSDSSNAFLDLPSELIGTIFGYLSPLELTVVAQVCKTLHHHAYADYHWQGYVLSHLPGNKLTTPYPFKTFRELYICHDPYWFIPKHKIWFSDRGLTGQMILVQYDQRRGVIEGYQLLAVRHRDGSEPWIVDQDVHIHYFEPKVALHRDRPVIKFNPQELAHGSSADDTSKCGSKRRTFAEHPMALSDGTDPRLTNVILARALTDDMVKDQMSTSFPYGYVWPPPTISTRHRFCGQAAGILPSPMHKPTVASPSNWKPRDRSEISDEAFRIRQWMEMGAPTLGVHLGEELVTFSTLDPKLYTPTPERPWRGIWVGDYSGHGCEFLLVNQPDLEGEDATPLARKEDETDDEYQKRFLRERVYKGRLEAVKLTGDPNVPRGEYTFIAKDLGQGGFIGNSQEPPFMGARVVESLGHIASMGFYNDKYMESQLLLISHNRLAQYWVGFGHISFFERVDIDKFLVPS